MIVIATSLDDADSESDDVLVYIIDTDKIRKIDEDEPRLTPIDQ